MAEDILIAFEEIYPALNDKRIIFRMDKHFKNGNKGKTKLKEPTTALFFPVRARTKIKQTNNEA